MTNELENRDFNDFSTDYGYSPELKRTVYKDEPEYDDSFKISVRFVNTNAFDLLVEDRKDFPDRIVISVNVRFCNMYVEWDYDFIHYKLKHEFGHIKQNYGNRYMDISQSRKFSGPDIDKNIFNFHENIELKSECVDVVQSFMYAFSPVEMQQRCAELYDLMDNMSNDELYDSIPEYSNRGDSIARFLEQYENIHWIGHLKKMINQCQTAILSNDYIIVLIIAYYFKEANIYKPKLPLLKGFVQSFLDDEELTTEDKIYATQFYQWLKRYLQKYIHNVYTVAHYIIYTRIWHYQDCRNLKKTKKIDEMCDFFEQIYSTDKH